MGCIESKGDLDKGNENQTKFSWETDDQLDIKDFTIANENNVITIRKPKTVNGQQFIIENCKGCVILILDYSAMVTVDNCENCKIIIGPVKGSVFLRNCKNCTFIIACQQYRSRDCRKIETFLYCSSQPIIENSSAMKFGCFQFNYNELESQFIQADLSIYSNNWSDIHDFTPVKEIDNWSLITHQDNTELSCMFDCNSFQDMDLSFKAAKSTVPLTTGKLPTKYNESCLLVFFDNSREFCAKFFSELKKDQYQIDIVRAKEVKMNKEDALRVFKSENYSSVVEKAEVIGVELNGEDAISSSKGILAYLGVNLKYVFLSYDQSNAKNDIDKFYNFVNMNLS